MAVGCWLLVTPASSQSSPNWRDSLNAVNKQIAQSPYSADLHFRKAAINLQLEQWEYAVEEYKLILRHDDQNLTALFYRAYAYTHLRRYDLARNDYNDILLRVPSHMEARLGLAYVCQQMGKRNDALDLLNLVVEQHPDSVAGYVARAALETDMKQYEAALYDWEQAMRLAPDNTDYHLSYVDVLIRLGRKEQARRELQQLEGRGASRSALHQYYVQLRDNNR